MSMGDSTPEQTPVLDSDRLLVQRGMRCLDRLYPGHEQKVDLNLLDVSSSYLCPLAQAAQRRYYVVLSDLEKDGICIDAPTLGFEPYGAHTGAILTQAWREAYTQRANASAEPDAVVQ